MDQVTSTGNNKGQWLNYGIVSIAVALIALFFPKTQYQTIYAPINSVWDQEDYLSDREFTYKPSEVRTEAQIRASHKPTYTKDQSIAIAEKQEMETLLESRKPFFPDMPDEEYARLRQIGYDFLHDMYRSGILAEWPERFPIVIESEGRSAEKQKEEVYTPADALSVLEERLTSSELAVLQPILERTLKPNLNFDAAYNERLMRDQVAMAAEIGVFKEGDVLLYSGEPISAQKAEIINAYNKDHLPKTFFEVTDWWRFLGYLLLTSLIISIFMVYLFNHDPQVFHKPRRLIFMLFWPVLFAMLVYFIEATGNISSYIIPFCIVPIIVRSFTNSRLALFTHVVVVLIDSFLSHQGYEFTFLELLAGIVAVLLVKETRDWSEFFTSLLLILLSYCIGYFGVSLILEGDLSGLEWRNYLWFFLNVLLTLLAYPLIPLLERFFGFTTSIRLTELADLNKPMLKDLSISAPGTLQHSLQVSNLCQAAAERIGANVELVKVAALYHDMGKLKNPEVFIENQTGHNPHDTMNNFESARAIIEHVTEGEVMAEKARLPKEIVDFIRTHHGNTRVEYFYRQQLQAHPDQEFDDSLFRYPGPLPFTKEQSIMMIADSLEAAAKSLKNPTGQDIDRLVEKIVEGKLKSNQLDSSPLTFAELEECKDTFRTMLRSINHVRVEYPPESKDAESTV